MAKFNISDMMNAKSKEFKEPTSFKIEHIDLDDIIRSEKNHYTLERIKELAQSIEIFGLSHNLVVRKLENTNQFELISGERRLLALRYLVGQGKAAYKKAPCKIEQSIDDVKAELQLILTNATARELSDHEKVYQVNRLKELLEELKKSGAKIEGRVREVIADILGVSSSQVEILESVDKNLTPELKEELKEGNINITTAYNISKLDDDKQKQLNENLKNGEEITSAKVKRIREETKEDLKRSNPPSKVATPKERKADHILKCHTSVFEDVVVELKTFEYRYDDRGYQTGDILRLCEYDSNLEAHTGRYVDVEVTYLLEGGNFGIPADYVIMSVRKLSGVY